MLLVIQYNKEQPLCCVDIQSLGVADLPFLAFCGHVINSKSNKEASSLISATARPFL